MSLPAIGSFVPRSALPGPNVDGPSPLPRPVSATTTGAASPSREAPVPLERAPRSGLGNDTTAIARFVAERPVEGSSGPSAIEAKRAARDAEVQGKMDDLRARYAGPYNVKGEKISAGPMFRMNGGCNDAKVAAHRGEASRASKTA